VVWLVSPDLEGERDRERRIEREREREREICVVERREALGGKKSGRVRWKGEERYSERRSGGWRLEVVTVTERERERE